MEQKPDLEMVYMAVSSLYNNPSSAEKDRASQWLNLLQKSVHAWTIADEMLHHKRDLESCYFAAQTMRSKIQQCFHELPVESHTSLRDSLLDHISQINENTNTVIVTQLCLALADLALQTPTWQEPVFDMIRRFSHGHVWPLLELLTVLPEELECRTVRLGENRRRDVMKMLQTCAPTVLEFLKHCCGSFEGGPLDNIQVNVKIIRCFTSWLSVSAVSLENIPENRVVAKAFSILSLKDCEKQPIPCSIHEAATECICTLLQCLEDNNNLQALEMYLFNSVMSLEAAYHLSVAHEDQDKSMNYCRIFTELAETYLDRIISNSTPTSQYYAIKVLDLVLICVGHHDYEVAEITFNLWYLLSEDLYQKNSKELMEMFRPYVERLITAVCRHCQMEPDHEGLLEDGDDFKDFRLKVSDLIRDVVFIVGSTNCFQQMFLSLQAPGVTWDASEAALFVMQSVAKNILPVENEVVPKAVEAILSLPETTHAAVRHTSALLMGELCDWIDQHPAVLDPTLNFLVHCLPVNGVGAAAAHSLQNICVGCKEHMGPHMAVLLQLLRQVDSERFALSNTAIVGLLRGAAAVISALPLSEVTAAFHQLCLLQTKSLDHLIAHEITPSKGTKTDPVTWLDRLSSIFRNINVTPPADAPTPCKEVALEVWPVLSRALDKYHSDVRITERACRSVRFLLRCASQQLREILQPLAVQIVRLYALNQHSCFLYVGSILVDEYATDKACIQGLLNMLEAFIEPTFHILQQENGLRNHPDTVDDFFRLCARLMQRAPVEFLQCAALGSILQCGLMSCSLDHKEANTSVMKFFYDLVSTGHFGKNQPDFNARRKLVLDILDKFGPELVVNLVQACVFYLHSYMLSEVSDVFSELLQLDRETTAKWLSNALEALPQPGSGGIITATPEQLNDVFVSITRSDSSKSITHALKDLTRLYR